MSILRNCVRDSRLLAVVRVSGIYDSIFFEDKQKKWINFILY